VSPSVPLNSSDAEIDGTTRSMNWQLKTRSAMPATAAGPGPKTATTPAPVPTRVSNGLKEFLWLLSDAGKGKLLDLGQVSQNTLNFFIERGFRVTTEDFLRSWREFTNEEEEKRRKVLLSQTGDFATPDALAAQFLEGILQYPPETFHGVLAWDLFDYMEPELLSRVVSRLHDILRPGGLVLSLFHSRTPDHYSRYRILENQLLEVLPTPPLAPHVRVFHNREILDLFGKFRSSKSFVGRDQIREALFLK
jgi:SAM-dependent methyltransferase